MRPFTYLEPTDISEATTLLRDLGAEACLIAGGSDLLGELKDDLLRVGALVSLARIERLREIGQEADGLRLGAMVTLHGMEKAPQLTGPLSLLAEAARGVATPEIRNQSTLGGNLCQHSRCLHYRSPWIACFKKGGTDCPARESEQQDYLSVMGGHECFSAHPSDLAPPLLALDAIAVVVGHGGERRLPLSAFFAPLEGHDQGDNGLEQGEILAAVIVPPLAADWRGTYLKARERTAGDFALVGVAFGCRLVQGQMRDVRLALTGVATAPKRFLEAEAVLEGQNPSAEIVAQAAEVVFAPATPLPHNGFKVALGQALVVRIIQQVTAD